MTDPAVDAQMAASPPASFTTRELTPGTWDAFEKFFAQHDGVQDGCWCMFYHRERPNRGQPREDRVAENRSDHRELVRRGRAHGVLVYPGDRVVGWCQFGPAPELPRIERGRKYPPLRRRLGEPPDWRITCFFVDRPYRRQGVAKVALEAALAAIRREGGGVAEAYPATHGHAVATWFGSESMFVRAGFTRVARFGPSNVLMRCTLRPMARSR